jgi:tetratricopeptide (TPR) repeat protein
VKLLRKSLILAVALLLFGAARLPFESALSNELRAAGLFPTPLEISTRERIGQTSSAVALGGLRTLVATFLNLRGFTFFTEQRWDDVADTYDTIVELAPHTRYYWETGAWHSAYNAASYYLNDDKLPALRRREAWRSSILRGRAFLERGIRNNPDDWSLPAQLGMLLSDSNKFAAFKNPDEAFTAAADAFRCSAETGRALGYVPRFRFYALARVQGREREALELGRELAESPQNRTPTLQTLLLVLEAHQNPSMDVEERAIELFGSPEKAYDALSGHWMRTRERYPVHGVARGLAALERKLNVPKEESIFNQTPPPPMNPDEMFQN